MMRLTELDAASAIAAAQTLIRATAATAVLGTANRLIDRMQAAATYRERGHLAFAQNHLLNSREMLLQAFGVALDAKVQLELSPKVQADSRAQQHLAAVDTDWGSMSLVGEDQIEDRMSFERIGHFITHECDFELRELSAYVSAILRHGSADPDRNPLRGEALGWALHQAIEKVTEDTVTQKILATELGQVMAREMRSCYAAIIADLKSRGVHPAELAVRQKEASGRAPVEGTPMFEDTVRSWERSVYGQLVADATEFRRRFPGTDESLRSGESVHSAALVDRLMRGGLVGIGSPMSRAPALVQSDAELMDLLRRLNSKPAVST